MRTLKHLLLIAVLFCSAISGRTQNIEDYFFPNGHEVTLYSNFMSNAYKSYVRRGDIVEIRTGVKGAGGGVISRKIVRFSFDKNSISVVEYKAYSFEKEVLYGYFDQLWLVAPGANEAVSWMGYPDIIDVGEADTNYLSCFRSVKIGSEIVEALKVTNEVKDIERENVIGECTQYWCKGYGLLYEETKPIGSGKPIIYSDYKFKGEVNDSMLKGLNDDTNPGVKIKNNESAPEDEIAEEQAIPADRVDEKPSFNGGDVNEFAIWVNSKLNYPEVAKENGVQGRVVIQFTVNPDGFVCNVKVLRGVDSSLDKEAVRVVTMSPKWTSPGKIDGKPVKVTYTFPVIFQLR